MGKIVAILSSPRQKGNSFDIVNAILDGAMGLSTNVIKLHRLDNLRSFHGCRACMGCKKSNACVQQDDVSQILEDMMDADCVIFSTPVYFGSPNAQYKVLEDRMFSFIHGDGSKAMTGKSATSQTTSRSPAGPGPSRISSSSSDVSDSHSGAHAHGRPPPSTDLSTRSPERMSPRHCSPAVSSV